MNTISLALGFIIGFFAALYLLMSIFDNSLDLRGELVPYHESDVEEVKCYDNKGCSLLVEDESGRRDWKWVPVFKTQ